MIGSLLTYPRGIFFLLVMESSIQKSENPDTIGYLKEGSDLYKQKGMEGLLRTISNPRNT